MRDRRLGLMVVGAAAITALVAAEPKTIEEWPGEVGATSVHVHKKSDMEQCLAETMVVASQPAVQPAREQAC